MTIDQSNSVLCVYIIDIIYTMYLPVCVCMPLCVCFGEFAEQVVFEGQNDLTLSPNYCSAGTNTHTHVLNIFVLKSAFSVFFSLQVTLLGPVVILASPPMVPGNRQISRSVPRFISAARRALI